MEVSSLIPLVTASIEAVSNALGVTNMNFEKAFGNFLLDYVNSFQSAKISKNGIYLGIRYKP